MQRTFRFISSPGFTLIEVLVTSVVAAVVASAALSFLNAGTILFAKNFSVTVSHNSVRVALDKLAQSLQQANDFPKLIDTTGAASSGSTAGIAFDRFLGGPYVVTHPGGTGLQASTTSITITRSTDPLASPPIPQRDDVLLMDESTARARVLSSNAAIPASNGRQSITLTLQASLGSPVLWSAGNIKSAKLVRRVAFIVMPGGGRSELRFYPAFEAVTDFNSPNQYSLVTGQSASASGEVTPFSVIHKDSESFLHVSLRARARDYDQVLATTQAKDFQTFLRVDTWLRPKTDI